MTYNVSMGTLNPTIPYLGSGNRTPVYTPLTTSGEETDLAYSNKNQSSRSPHRATLSGGLWPNWRPLPGSASRLIGHNSTMGAAW